MEKIDFTMVAMGAGIVTLTAAGIKLFKLDAMHVVVAGTIVASVAYVIPKMKTNNG